MSDPQSGVVTRRILPAQRRPLAFNSADTLCARSRAEAIYLLQSRWMACVRDDGRFFSPFRVYGQRMFDYCHSVPEYKKGMMEVLTFIAWKYHTGDGESICWEPRQVYLHYIPFDQRWMTIQPWRVKELKRVVAITGSKPDMFCYSGTPLQQRDGGFASSRL